MFVGYHMLMGHEPGPYGIPDVDGKKYSSERASSSTSFHEEEERRDPLSDYDPMGVMCAIPVSRTNLFKLLSSKARVY